MCVRVESLKSCDDAGGGGRLHTVQPTVACSNVNENHCVAIATKRQAVTKDNVHVDLVQIATALAQWLACGRIHDGRKRTKSGRKLSRVDELGIRRCHSKVLLVPEAAATKYLVKLGSAKDSSVLTGRSSVVGAHIGKVSSIAVEEDEQGWRKGACCGR